MIIHRLKALDYTQVGGPMGTVKTPTIFSKGYTSITKAKAAAESDYRVREKSKTAKITWQKDGTGWTSGDLRYICYDIIKEKVL